jgi:hypothetical protein
LIKYLEKLIDKIYSNSMDEPLNSEIYEQFGENEDFDFLADLYEKYQPI